MNHYCKIHPNKKALSLCHSCGEYYCSDCLHEGLEYYYCKKDECAKVLNKELSQKRNIKVETIPFSKESIFIKRVAMGFTILSSIAIVFFTINLGDILSFAFSSPLLESSPKDIKINIIGFYMFKYFGVVLIISLLLMSFSLFASIKFYQLKNRILFLYALIFNIILIILYNVFVYSYFDFVRESSIAVLGYQGYNNFWSIEKYSIGIISFLIMIVFVYLFKRFSSEKIKQVFVNSNA